MAPCNRPKVKRVRNPHPPAPKKQNLPLYHRFLDWRFPQKEQEVDHCTQKASK